MNAELRLWQVSRVFHQYSKGRFLRALGATPATCSNAGESCSATECCAQRFETCFQRTVTGGVGGGIAGLSGFSVAVGYMEPRKSGTFF